MPSSISLPEVYDKNLNLLIGSGASAGLLPTLQLRVHDGLGNSHTIETLGEHLAGTPRLDLLLMHYYATCVRPAQVMDFAAVRTQAIGSAVLNNYGSLIETLLHILRHRRPMERRCNVFTTNYDGCFTASAEWMLSRGQHDFVINDGSRGFQKRFLDPRHFQSFMCQTSVFERHQESIPQINLLHLHGSVYWRREDSNVLVDYRHDLSESLLNADQLRSIQPFSDVLARDNSTEIELRDAPDLDAASRASFHAGYQKLPIINPTKKKFHETLFEEHYYQMLRQLSYELEKPSTVLITFGFSFADEHILSLVKRSLSNPSLQVFVCCFGDAEHGDMLVRFRSFKNVSLVHLPDTPLTFSEFNRTVFTSAPNGLDPAAPGLAARQA